MTTRAAYVDSIEVVSGGTEEDLARLRKRIRGREAFPVVRRGIQDEPRRMRLGVELNF